MSGFFARWFRTTGIGRGSVSFGLGAGSATPPAYIDVRMAPVRMDADASIHVAMDDEITMPTRSFTL